MHSLNELRKDYLLNEWVIISARRALRPHDYKWKEAVLPKRDAKCPFCPGNEKETPPEIFRIENKKKWEIRVFPNKYAALSTEKSFKIQKKGFFEKGPAFGFHEVLVETSEHSKQMSEFSEKDLMQVLKVYGLRFKELKKKKDVKFVLIFKNYGKECGASLIHNHTQISSFPIIPERIDREMKSAKKFFNKKKKCIFCKIVELEKKSKRKVFENPSFLVIAPFASKWPYEAWILSKKHKENLLGFSEKELLDLAKLLKKLLLHYKELFGDPPYNFVLHQSMNSSKYYHFHIEVFPNIHKVYGGIEKGSGVILNEVPPETAAKYLKKTVFKRKK